MSESLIIVFVNRTDRRHFLSAISSSSQICLLAGHCSIAAPGLNLVIAFCYDAVGVRNLRSREHRSLLDCARAAKTTDVVRKCVESLGEGKFTYRSLLYYARAANTSLFVLFLLYESFCCHPCLSCSSSMSFPVITRHIIQLCYAPGKPAQTAKLMVWWPWMYGSSSSSSSRRRKQPCDFLLLLQFL